ncbi:unnamed protein product [Zymoseptoria tritici ST99CH_1A5]|nr:unnamed protein product [Zymoseptoria tritici ST99CH_3D7]SMR48752.1 unnamed protein product [Zymoseptoria tritici ST99CH_1E4]SMR49938.1 unnamed protein product [Zymoseptoria tritici ST99CH_3D1]SMY22639.1 unnamed protein product [Zymoseptoria tritici ST99CH_1A5]
MAEAPLAEAPVTEASRLAERKLRGLVQYHTELSEYLANMRATYIRRGDNYHSITPHFNTYGKGPPPAASFNLVHALFTWPHHTVAGTNAFVRKLVLLRRLLASPLYFEARMARAIDAGEEDARWDELLQYAQNMEYMTAQLDVAWDHLCVLDDYALGDDCRLCRADRRVVPHWNIDRRAWMEGIESVEDFWFPPAETNDEEVEEESSDDESDHDGSEHGD